MAKIRKKGARAITKISIAPSSKHFPSRRKPASAGFTLMEVMIVLAIIAATIAIAAPKLVDKKSEMKSTVRTLSTRIRDIHNKARLNNSTYRLVISMEDEKKHSFWVESKSGQALLLTEEQQKERERLTSSQREDEEGGKSNDGFAADPAIMKEPMVLRDLLFEEVEFGSRNAAITSGAAYIHFFPSGLAEESAIHITDRDKKLHWTLAIHPLTGKVDIIEGNVSIKEIRNQ